MGAKWAKNEPTAAKRRCGMRIFKNDGSLAPRGTDFMALGYVYICGTAAPDFALALGTMTNQRKPLSVSTQVVGTVDTGADSAEIVGHPYETGDGPFSDSSISGGAEVWIIVDDADNIGFATSLANAYADTRIALTGAETGSSITLLPNTKRGIDGLFVYQATQAETNHDNPETIVIVDGGGSSDYDRDIDGGAYTTVEMQSTTDDIGATLLEGSLTRDDAWRIMLRTDAAKYSKTGNDFVYRDMADSKDSHHGTVTTAGRIDADVDDPT